jgi:hypothetical protein
VGAKLSNVATVTKGMPSVMKDQKRFCTILSQQLNLVQAIQELLFARVNKNQDSTFWQSHDFEQLAHRLSIFFGFW